jgi:hypothetical protein
MLMQRDQGQTGPLKRVEFRSSEVDRLLRELNGEQIVEALAKAIVAEQ